MYHAGRIDTTREDVHWPADTDSHDDVRNRLTTHWLQQLNLLRPIGVPTSSVLDSRCATCLPPFATAVVYIKSEGPLKVKHR